MPEGELNFGAPARLYWFELSRSGGTVRWIPHLIDDRSGVGTHGVVEDATGDGLLDIITASEKGAFVFAQQRP